MLGPQLSSRQWLNQIGLHLERNREVDTPDSATEVSRSRGDEMSLGLHSCRFVIVEDFRRLEKLETLSLGANNFNKSIISCLSFLPSLKTLDLRRNEEIGTELSSLRELKTLDMSYCGLQSIAFNGTMSKLVHLNLDWNAFFSVDDVMRSMAAAFPSLRFLSLGNCDMGGRLLANGAPYIPYLKALILSRNNLNGTLPIEGFCKLKNLHELDLSSNIFDGKLPECFNRLSSLQLFDISSNQLTGVLLSSVITNLTSLKYVDFRSNKFEGSFSLSWFSNLTELKYFAFASDNDDFDVETEEPVGWTCMFQLEVLILSSCNINRYKGSVIPSFLLHQHKLRELDMSYNSLKGQFPNWLIKNNTMLSILHLRDNSFDGTIYTSSYRNRNIRWLDVSGSHMIDPIPNDTQKSLPYIYHLNLSRNSIDGVIPSSIGDLIQLHELDLSHNRLSGEVPIGLLTNPFDLSLLILSNNSFHGEILSQNFNFCGLSVLQLGNNCFTVLTLDISNNYLSGRIPHFLGELSNLRILLLGKNNFSGSIPRQLCHLTNVNLIDLSNNLLSGSIPRCLQNIAHPSYPAFMQNNNLSYDSTYFSAYQYNNGLDKQTYFKPYGPFIIPSEILFTTKTLSMVYKGDVLDIMSGLDLSCNKLRGNIPEELGLLAQIHALNLSHNRLTGPIPVKFSNLANLESLDLSFNSLTGRVPPELIKLNSLEVFNVSFNNLSGRLPEIKAQFGTFAKESYEGNPLLCGLPLENECITESHGTQFSNEEGSDEKWYDMDMMVVSYG
ncbi:hypothetical protein E3N88_23034 [Mikania micrantha]|uniref:Leucine-rich repeat-containing N-terminal plant-type domain-containing protein n=1 Tax=Mikania micrantha TaxID=192012 RepID=A0A5N6NDL0_9ASTR|nr:hypothetical protein E3N88_23034 [Mikania micrantha]